MLCPRCGAENPERARFCLECGTALGAPRRTGEHGVRKLVTILFADVVGSTALGERIDPETLQAVLARYFSAARTVLERHGGTVEKFIGDAVMAVFGVPVLHEDDALRGARAALELRSAIARLNDELAAERGLRVEFRIGVNTGEVVAGVGAGETLVTGDAVNVAARLEQNAGAGEILIGESTHRLVRDFVETEPAPPLQAKGKSEPVAAYRLVRLAKAGGQGARGVGLSFVGRRRELSRLTQAFEDAQLERRCYLFTLLGAAGVGKSRLVDEYVASLGTGATVLRGRCLPYGEGITYWPITEVVRAAAGFQEEDDAKAARDRIAALLKDRPDAERMTELVASAVGLSAEAAPREELFWAIRRLLETIARERPLVCLIEDIHWAEPTLLDLLENVADWTRDAPVLLILSARPELLESRPSWGGGKLNATTLMLEPLSPDLTRELVEALLDRAALPAGVLQRVLDTSEGNPLFAEEMVRMLADMGAAGGELEQVRMPTSVQAVIAARLDRLPPDERLVAERASVAGRVFERSAVLELVPVEERSRVPEHLLALVRKELVHPDQPQVTMDEAFRFRHLLIRDAAYEALPKQERAELHERFGDWVDRAAGDRRAEYDEIVGYHLEQAHRFRLELGRADEHTSDLAERAGERLMRAGTAARSRGDLEAAIKLLRRALHLLSDGTRRRAAWLLMIDALLEYPRYEEAMASANELMAEAQEAGDEPALYKARLLREQARFWSDLSLDMNEVEQFTREAKAVFEQRGDDEGLAMAYGIEALRSLSLSQWAKTMAANQLAMRHAAAAGDTRRAERHRVGYLGSAIWSPMPVAELLAGIEAERSTIVSNLGIANLLKTKAAAEAMAGNAEQARADVAEAYRLREEIDGPGNAPVFTHGMVEAILGDNAAAEAALTRNADIYERQGEAGLLSTTFGYQARIRFDRGRPDDEVVPLAERCRELAAVDDRLSQTQWRQVLALVAARAGRYEEAQRLIDEAIEIAGRSDFIDWQAVLARDRGQILQISGDVAGARREYATALRLFEQKGNVSDAARTRRMLGRDAL